MGKNRNAVRTAAEIVFWGGAAGFVGSAAAGSLAASDQIKDAAAIGAAASGAAAVVSWGANIAAERGQADD